MPKSFQFYCLLILFTGLSFSEVMATHLRAGDITIVRIGCTSRFKIILHVYTRSNVQVKFGGGTLDFGDGSTPYITPSDPNPPIIAVVDNGGVGAVTDTIEHVYAGSGLYTITYYEQNRNEGVLNMDNSVETPFFIQSQILIDPLVCDNSPVLLVPPIDEGCTGVPWLHNPGAYDPDGDSLSYKLFVPKQGFNVDVSGYLNPNSEKFYSAIGIPPGSGSSPNGPPTFTIDPVTGTITWNAPGESGEYNIAFIISEWRKIGGTWVNLGYVERDMQVIIESCNNKPPKLQTPKDTCILAGTLLTQFIYATDPDGIPPGANNGVGDSVKIEAFSDVFSLESPFATITPGSANPDKPVWQPTFSPTQQAQIKFNWQTTCNDVKEQPYLVVFKATDNGVPSLTTFATWRITVVAPPPQWTSAVLNAGTRSSQLTWKLYSGECSGVPITSTMQIWRRVDSYPFSPSQCVTGMPDNLGYTMIAQVPIGTTTYTDKGLAAGAKYCYRLVAAFPQPNGGESYVSQEICIPPIIVEAPVITNVTVDVTDPQAGQITVKWNSPFQEPDQVNFPKPYSYVVYRADGFTGNTNLTPLNPGKQADSVFVDNASGLNTSQNVYNYRVLAYASNGNFVDTSAIASSVRLDLKPYFKQIQLNWSANVPWSNNTLEYPMHLIYRGTTGATKISDLTLIDSVNVDVNMFTYLDSGQYNNTPLVQTQNYCYAVMTKGSYGNPLVKAPLINFSEITCSEPDDKVPPCAPTIVATGIDCSAYTNSTTTCQVIGPTGSASYSNTLTWKRPTDPNCKTDIKGYNVYAASAVGQSFTKIASLVTDTFYVQTNLPSYAQCYQVSAVDRADNESKLSAPFCFDNCPYYELPNVFTPNGDGCNDFFSAFSLRNYGEGNPCSSGNKAKDSTHTTNMSKQCARFVLAVTFTVYNRWGKEVYTYQSGGENTIYIDWNGRDNSGRDLDASTYYYIANVIFDVVDPRQRNKTIKGWVQIIR